MGFLLPVIQQDLHTSEGDVQWVNPLWFEPQGKRNLIYTLGQFIVQRHLGEFITTDDIVSRFISQGCFALVAGRLGDIYGLKLAFVSGLSWFTVWILVSAFMPVSTAPVQAGSRPNELLLEYHRSQHN